MALGPEATYIIVGCVLGALCIIIIIVIFVACRRRSDQQVNCGPPQCFCPWTRTNDVARTDYIIRQPKPATIKPRKNIKLRMDVTEASSQPNNIMTTGNIGYFNQQGLQKMNTISTGNVGQIGSSTSQRVVMVTGPEVPSTATSRTEFTSGVRDQIRASGPFVATVPLDGRPGLPVSNNGLQFSGNVNLQPSYNAMPATSGAFNVDNHVSHVQCQDIHGPAAVQCLTNNDQSRLYPTLGTMMRQEGMNQIHIHASVPPIQSQGSRGTSADMYAGHTGTFPPAYTTLPRT